MRADGHDGGWDLAELEPDGCRLRGLDATPEGELMRIVMKPPRIRILGWSWLGVLNFGVFQWFFVRLQGVVDTETNLMRLGWIGPIVPLTGWWTPYIRVERKDPDPRCLSFSERHRIRCQRERHDDDFHYFVVIEPAELLWWRADGERKRTAT